MAVDTKSFLASRTLWGGALLVLGFVLQLFKKEPLSPEETETFTTNLMTLAAVGSEVLGGILVVVGRFKATKSIHVIPP